MINLEWLRTFRAVYRTKSLSKASDILQISQPTASQHIATLEAHLGQKLFDRKSKGVQETDEGRRLNTLVAGALETLEDVEYQLEAKHSEFKSTISIGISPHLYKTILCPRIQKLSNQVHVKFGTKQELIREVEEGRLLYAVVPDEIDTFDIICHKLFDQHLTLVGSKDIKLEGINDQFKVDMDAAEKKLTQQTWYAHDFSSSFIKLYWINKFNKKRPSVMPNYVIPNEYELLFQLSHGSGLTIAFEQNARSFIAKGTLQEYGLDPVYMRCLSLICNKKKAIPEVTDNLISMLCS
ncbi:MAG: LysR family transcriptional regulator [Flavobacteriales bacterium]|nr:LysR family transcriptional regulator [Flavobacteriales bacterium]